jgi:hypothetical protein
MEPVMTRGWRDEPDWAETSPHGTTRGAVNGVKFLTAPDMSVTITETELRDAFILLLRLYEGRYEQWLAYDESEQCGSMAAALTRARGESMDAGLELSFNNQYYASLIRVTIPGLKQVMMDIVRRDKANGN